MKYNCNKKEKIKNSRILLLIITTAWQVIQRVAPYLLVVLCLSLTTCFFVLIHSISHLVLGVGEEEHEQRVDKTLENEWQEVLRILLNFVPCSIKCGNFKPIDHSATRLK